MATPFFKFKKFTIWHDKCAMKVGTDGVLLGALAPSESVKRILDVGTGTGLIALMLAQRTEKEQDVTITAVELDKDAVLQAQENINHSPWANRISVVSTDYRTYSSTVKFDLIVSNPPYFVNAIKSPLLNRTQARHTDSLSFEDLITKSATLLADRGVFEVIIPTDGMDRFFTLAKDVNLTLLKRIMIKTTPIAIAKRVVLFFSKENKEIADIEDKELLIELERHQYSDDYIRLTKSFYLKM